MSWQRASHPMEQTFSGPVYDGMAKLARDQYKNFRSNVSHVGAALDAEQPRKPEIIYRAEENRLNRDKIDIQMVKT
jgi:hypothetical protein